jgi:hypothetical protein
MKSLAQNLQAGMALVILAVMGFAPVASAAVTNGAVTAAATNSAVASTNNAAGATNAAAAELPVPLSVFNLTLHPTKDPFFPLSTRQPVASTNNALAFSATEFILKGLSGSAHSRLALINNRTVADGEDAEITTVSGKVKIHCQEIKDNSVVIRAGPQREVMEIFLRKSAQ